MFQKEEPAMKFPPRFSPPGSGSHLRSDEIRTGDLPSHDLPSYMGRTFPAMCQFWVLTGEWTSVYYTPEQTPVLGRVPVEFAEKTFRKLLAWADNLHIMLARGDQSTHHCVILQLVHSLAPLH
jgi:hypothetical protein